MSCFLHDESSCLALCQPGCCLLSPSDLEHQLAELPLVLLIAQKKLKVLGFPGGLILHCELLREAVSQPLLCLYGVRLVGVSGENEVLHHLVQDLQADSSKCMRQVCEGMKEDVPILDKDGILGVGYFICLVIQEEVQHGGFVSLGKEPIRSAQAVRDR